MTKENNDKEENGQNKFHIAAPHDKTFRKILKDPRIAEDILEQNLPTEILQDINLNTMENLDGSFISKELKETFKDILYGVKTDNHDYYIAFLFEHKSTADKLAIVQIGRYMMDIWEKSLQKSNEMPVVIPIVFYHGESAWNYHTDMRKYIRNYEQLSVQFKDRLPTMKHDFINIQDQDEQFIQKYQPLTRMFIRIFKYIHSDKNVIIEVFIKSVDEAYGHVLNEDIEIYVPLLLVYISNANRDFNKRELMRNIKNMEGKGEAIMTILEESKQEGRQEGRKEAAANMLENGLSVDEVIKYSNLPRKTVEELKKNL